MRGRFFFTIASKTDKLTRFEGTVFMDARPPRFLIMVTIAILIFIGASALLILQSRASKKPSVEVAE